MKGEPDDLSAIPVAAIESAWARLRKRERTVLRRRNDGETLEEIGKDLAITRERVRQIEAAGKRKFTNLLRTSDDDWQEWRTANDSGSTVVDLRALCALFDDSEAARHFLPLVLEALTWSPTKKQSPWWVRDGAAIFDKACGLLFDEPLRKTEWDLYAADSGLPNKYIEYLIAERILPIEFVDDYVIRRKYRRRDRAHAYLLEHGPSRIERIAEALGEETPRNLSAYMERQEVFTKIFPSGEWALAEFVDVRHKKAIDAMLEILADQGPLSLPELKKQMAEIFPVSAGRIQQCLNDFRIGTMPDGRIWLVEHGAEIQPEPEPARPAHLYCSGSIVGLRRIIDRDVIRGSGLMDHKWLAWKLGLHSTPRKAVFAGTGNLPELAVTRSGGMCQISSLRESVQLAGYSEGCSVVILFNLENHTWELRHTCRKKECSLARE